MSATTTSVSRAATSANANVKVNANVNKWAIAITVALGAMLEIVDTSIVNVALTDMQASLGATLSDVGWVVTSYAIANVIILPLTAWLGDVFGKKRYFIFSLIGFTVSSVLCGMSHSLGMLIAARVLQGLTGGGLLSKAQSILFETFPREEQGMAQALFGVVAIAGPTVGPTLGGYIVTNLDWRWIFFINVPVGIIASFMAMAYLQPDVEQPVSNRSVDWLGIALLIIGIGSLQTVIEEGNAEDWFSSRMISSLSVAAVVGLVAFVWRQLTVEHPVVDLRVLRHKSLAAGSVLSFVLGIGLYGTIFAIPIFAQSILKMTAEQTGILMIPGALASAVAMPILGKIAPKVDARALLVFGSLVLIGSLVMFARISPMTGDGDLFLPLIVRSFGSVFIFLPLSLAAIGPLPKKDMAAATGVYNLMRQLGGGVGIAFLATMLDTRQAFHRAVLAEHLSVTDPSVQTRLSTYAHGFTAKGMASNVADSVALKMLDGQVRLQASVMSFSDTFVATAVIIVATLPLILLLGKGGKNADAGAAH